MSRTAPRRPDQTPGSSREAGRSGLARRLATTALHGVALFATLVGGAWVIWTFQPFGHRDRVVTAACSLLAGLAWGLRLRGGPPARRRVPRWLPWVVIGELIVWAGLIAWSIVSPGGPIPSPKADPGDVRVLTWNILHGKDAGPPWVRRGWPARKHPLGTALRAAGPDILGVQEALIGQLEFIDAVLPRHRRVGVGRDDGRSGGEHCAIYYDADRFDLLDGGTFWLDEPADAPPRDLDPLPKRTCSWARLRDRRGGRALRVYNTHWYLTEGPRLRAARIMMERVSSGDASDAVLVVGDFNATPLAPSRAPFRAAGLVSAAELAGEPVGLPTHHFYGIRLRGLDDVYLGRSWRRVAYRIVDAKPGNIFPSDHFGILVDLTAGP
ncbi:endonuclease/exonuclease/phosphatase family protein [Paludisphaera sp.]|uniref:endonuclease/exonuclease/phosphatase family protein n=1 Tax=Paludisphaera sp. TaxID=2017432 RepID=UPI00301C9ED4